MKNIFKFIKRIIGHLLKGQYSEGLHLIICHLPVWLIVYDKAHIMHTKAFRFPEKLNSEIHVKIADESDVDDIVRISGVQDEHILSMMKAGSVCFISHTDGNPPACVSLSCNGCTFVRGMGFYYDLGLDGYYSYGSVTVPEARGKGHYLRVESEKIKYELKKGAKRFFGLITFDNKYSYSLQERLGYHPILETTYLKLLFLKICKIKDLSTHKTTIRVFIKEPDDNVLVI